MGRVMRDTDDDFPGMHDSPSWPDEDYSMPRRRRLGGWIVAVSLLLSVGLLIWAAEKRFHLVARATGAKAQPDPRVESFLAGGEKALLDGNLDEAQRAFDKASALVERGPRVLLDEARLAAARADVPWLKLRLLPTEASDEVRATRAQLDDRVAAARRAADDAVSAGPADPRALQAKLDALRIAGELDAARGYVVAVFAQASQPETAYVLAALDLAQPGRPSATVIDRLRVAAAAEGNSGRARAALVYALAQAGDLAAAKAELAKLDSLARPYPLLPNLHALVAPAAPAARDAGVAVAAVEPSSVESAAPLAAASTPSPRAQAAVRAPAARGGDSERATTPRSALQAATTAIQGRQFDRAEQIYQGILVSNPNDSEALAGLGDLARLRGDSSGAIAAYKRAIAVNRSYLPALLGVADTEWSSGDRANAARVYDEVINRFPEGTYPGYVAQRAGGSAP